MEVLPFLLGICGDLSLFLAVRYVLASDHPSFPKAVTALAEIVLAGGCLVALLFFPHVC